MLRQFANARSMLCVAGSLELLPSMASRKSSRNYDHPKPHLKRQPLSKRSIRAVSRMRDIRPRWSAADVPRRQRVRGPLPSLVGCFVITNRHSAVDLGSQPAASSKGSTRGRSDHSARPARSGKSAFGKPRYHGGGGSRAVWFQRFAPLPPSVEKGVWSAAFQIENGASCEMNCTTHAHNNRATRSHGPRNSARINGGEYFLQSEAATTL